jgi:hypothetical protein
MMQAPERIVDRPDGVPQGGVERLRIGCRGRYPPEVGQHILLALEALPVGGQRGTLYGGVVFRPEPYPALVAGDSLDVLGEALEALEIAVAVNHLSSNVLLQAVYLEGGEHLVVVKYKLPEILSHIRLALEPLCNCDVEGVDEPPEDVRLYLRMRVDLLLIYVFERLLNGF